LALSISWSAARRNVWKSIVTGRFPPETLSQTRLKKGKVSMAATSNPIVWFEIPVSDMRRAIKFYEATFETRLEPTEVQGMQLAFFQADRESYGAGGALVHSPPIEPSHQGTTVYFRVASIDPALEKIVRAGGKTLIPRRSIGQYGFIAQFEDSEGNRVALHEMGAM
jgi:uncharacterized protein